MRRMTALRAGSQVDSPQGQQQLLLLQGCAAGAHSNSSMHAPLDTAAGAWDSSPVAPARPSVAASRQVTTQSPETPAAHAAAPAQLGLNPAFNSAADSISSLTCRESLSHSTQLQAAFQPVSLAKLPPGDTAPPPPPPPQQQQQQLESATQAAAQDPCQQQQLPSASLDLAATQDDQQKLQHIQVELQEQLRLLEQLLSRNSATLPSGAPATPARRASSSSNLAAGAGSMGFAGARMQQGVLQPEGEQWSGGVEAAAPAWQHRQFWDAPAVTGPRSSAKKQNSHLAQSQQNEGDAAAAIAAAMAAAAAAQQAAAGSIIDAVAPPRAATPTAPAVQSQASKLGGEQVLAAAAGLTVAQLEQDLHASGKASIAIRRINTTLGRLAQLVHGPKADPSVMQVSDLLQQWPLLDADILYRLQPEAKGDHIKPARAQTIYAYSVRQLLEMPQVQQQFTKQKLYQLQRRVEADTTVWKRFKPPTAQLSDSRGSAAAAATSTAAAASVQWPSAAARKKRKSKASSAGSPGAPFEGYGSEESQPAAKRAQYTPGQSQ